MTHVVGEPVWVANERRRVTMWARFGAFAAAMAASAGATGVFLASLAGESTALTAGFVAASALLLARDAWAPRIPLPQIRAQVPAVLRGTRYAGPVVYGLLLGPGVLTRIPSGLFYVYVFGVIAFTGPLEGLAVGVVFGLGYAGAVLVLGREMPRAQARRHLNVVTSAVQRLRVPSIAVSAAAAAALPLFQLVW